MSSKNADVKAIRELMQAHADAIRARDSARALGSMALCVTSYQLRPPLEYRDGAARRTEDMDAWFATWDGPLEIEIPDPTILVDDDVAVAWGLSRLRGKKRGGQPIELWYRTTLVFQRQVGMWKLVHHHASFPTRMDGSETSATDLAPA